MRAKLYLLAVIVARCALGAGAADCGIEIVVEHRPGESLPHRVSVFKGKDGIDLASRFQGTKAAELPCGSYEFELRRSDYPDLSRNLDLMKGSVELRDVHQRLTLEPQTTAAFTPMGVFFRDGSRPFRLLKGRIIGVLNVQEGWARVRLISLTKSNPAVREVALEPDGSFAFRNTAEDWYLVTVLQGKQLLGATQVDLNLNPTILEVSIDVPYASR